MPFLGPAFIACVAYVDPGNFATNVAGGAQFGYALGWVVLTANLMAMLVQSLSAKLGIATGKSLPEVCRDRLPALGGPVPVGSRPSWSRWPPTWPSSPARRWACTWSSGSRSGSPRCSPRSPRSRVLAMEVGGFRRLEAVIAALVGVVVLAFCLELLMSRPPAAAVAAGVFVPRLPGGAALLAVSIVGATVMPHVIYLHSALVRRRVASDSDATKRRIFRFEIVDVVCAMGLAGLINLAMLAMAAAVFFTRGDTGAGQDLGQVVSGLDSFVGVARGHRVRRGPAGLRGGVLLRRDDVRAGGDGGLPAPPDPGVPAPRGDDAPGPGRARRSASARPAPWCSARSSCPSASRSR